MSRHVYVIDAVRTPIGRYGRALAGVRPDDLAAGLIAELVQRTGVDTSTIEDVVLGCANGAGEDNRNVARMAALLAGLPHEVPGSTVNRLCASGLEAVMQAARAARAGEGELFLAGGTESMTRAPLVMLKPERGHARGDRTIADSTIGWRFVNPRMDALASTASMGETAENVAERWGIERERQDRYALSSHRRAVAAADAGLFADELIAVDFAGGRRNGEGMPVVADECPRADASSAALARLEPVFRADGTVTAGNSAPINDGAACLLLGSDSAVDGLGRRPLARIISAAVAGVDPAVMGIGPVPATHKALERAGLSLDDVDLIELNEAFAAQVLACVDELGIDPAKLNVNGGGIALGHPLGSSGARIVGALCWELRRRKGRYGLATMCVGVGQGAALIVERDEACA